MAEQLYALGDIGASNLRVGVYNNQIECLAVYHTGTNPDDYESTVQTIADTVEQIAGSRGPVVAASMAVAAEVSDTGELTRSGGLSPWIGRNLGQDLEAAFDLPNGLVGTPNDVVAIALSQQAINLRNGRPVRGIATTLSSGWGGALYWEEGVTKSDEPGHEHLRSGSMCPCGQEGHAEAFVSGLGVKINHGMDMQEWLATVPGAQHQLVSDLSNATASMVERHMAANDFEAEEIRWTGGVALSQSFIVMQRLAVQVQNHFGQKKPAFDSVTMGDQAGLHGTFIDAQRRAEQY
jgi:predicted NBD/HSP70 family sugar kinase